MDLGGEEEGRRQTANAPTKKQTRDPNARGRRIGRECKTAVDVIQKQERTEKNKSKTDTISPETITGTTLITGDLCDTVQCRHHIRRASETNEGPVQEPIRIVKG